ncbi:MAG: ABC transporter substrate-binding protein [Zymomonas mobilis subsp. pomaceae]
MTDTGGHIVTVPVHPKRFADLWFPIDEVMVMLGASDKVVVTVGRSQTMPWLFHMAPELNKAIQINGPVPNAETLQAAAVDVAFTASDSPATAAVNRIGIPTLEAGFTNTHSFGRAINLIADVVHTDTAHQAADRYNKEVTQVVTAIRAKTDLLSLSARPRVLHILSLAPLQVDGDHTIIDEWITVAGGRNAAVGVTGNKKVVSPEQLAQWDPDIIILGASARHNNIDEAVWKNLRAVRDKKVFRNPSGAFAWDRYGLEYPLQLQWTAKLLHPDLFSDIDIRIKTAEFYRNFMHYSVSPKETDAILAALPPAGNIK